MRYVLTLLFVLGALLRQPFKVSAGFPENTNITVYAFIQPANSMQALAVYTAIKHLEATDLMNANIVFSLTYLTNGCNHRLPTKVIMDAISNNRRMFDNIGGSINGILIGDCDEVCLDVGLLGSIYQISVMSYGCQIRALNRNSGYKTFVRSISSENHLPMLLHDLAINRRWSRVALFQSQVADEYVANKDSPRSDQEEDHGEFSLVTYSTPEAQSWVDIIRGVMDNTRGRITRSQIISNLFLALIWSWMIRCFV